MARESQGLQIALIIFVMLTILLAVGTFMFWKQFDKERARAVAAEEEQAKAQTAAKTFQDDANDLRGMLGEPTTAPVDTISEDFKADMEKYAVAGYSQQTRDYRKVLAHLFDINQKLSASLAGEQADRNKAAQAHEKERQTLLAEVATQKQRADDAAAQLVKLQADYKKSLETARAQAQNELARLAKDQETHQKEIESLQAQLKQAQNERDRAVTLAEQLRKRLEEMKPTYQLADGKIRWVNQANQTVYIDLGRADALPRLMSFAVYPADTSDVTKVSQKGSIEVTRILDDHLAEARIIEDDVTDPIMPGDVIDTTLWNPGEQEHFALTSGMDIDDDGKSDLQRLVNIITANGGVVDCYLDDTDPAPENAKRVGDVTNKTGYLVIGKEPESEPVYEDLRKLWSQLQRDADSWGLTKITLKELLNRMGWRNQTPIVRFGRGANPADFRAKPPEGVPRVSGGNVTDLFKRRRPPGGGRDSAY